MTPRRKFTLQRSGARRRGVEWQLTFEEWRQIWSASGHWADRGCGSGKYCMCRRHDVGPYSVGNVYIDTFSHNAKTGPRNFAERSRAAALVQKAAA